MRFANMAGRAAVEIDGRTYDVERASEGAFSCEPNLVYGRWDELRDWVSSKDWGRAPDHARVDVVPGLVRAPSPSPRQVFGVGLNYRKHAAEANLPLPEFPVIFTKFPSCLAGPFADIELPSANVDWEVELVVVMGRESRNVPEAGAWDHIAGISVGQDVSERVVQGRPPIPQFSMGKSFPTFGPFGPHVVTVDEIADPNDLELICTLNGTEMQHERTSDLIFSVPELIAYLSGILPLFPGDVIFTGTPSGVGSAREPKVFLQAGDLLVSEIPGVGRMQQACRPRTSHQQPDEPALAS